MHRSNFLRALVGAVATTLVLSACGGGGPTGPATPLAPTVASFAPEVAPRGASITISGSNFGDSAGAVTVGGHAAAVTDWTASSITATVPEAAANGWTEVAVTTAGGTATQAGLFVGVEYTGDAAGLQGFLYAQPRGAAILLGAQTYNLAAAGPSLIVSNVELFGRGAAETQLLPSPTGAVILVAEFGGLAGVTDLTVSGGTFGVYPGSISEDPYTVSLDPLPTVVVRNAVIDAPNGIITGAIGPLAANLEIHDSEIATGATDFNATITGYLLISGSTLTGTSVVAGSITDRTEISDSTVVADHVMVGGQSGLSVQDSTITAEDGDIELRGNPAGAFAPVLPGGPVVITGSSLAALDANLADVDFTGSIAVITQGGRIEITDNPRIHAQGHLQIFTDDNVFEQGSILVARNPNIHVGVFTAEDPVNPREGQLYIASGSVVLPSTISFVANEFAVSHMVLIDGHGPANLIVSDNTGVVGEAGSAGFIEVYGYEGDVRFSNNVLEITTELYLRIDGTADDTFEITNNQVVVGGDGIYVPAEGFGTVLVAGNNFQSEAPIDLGGTGDLTVIDNTFASPDRGVEIFGHAGAPLTTVTFSKNVLLTGDDALQALTFTLASSVLMEDNTLMLVGNSPLPVRALVIDPDGYDMQLTANRNTFTDYDQALFIDNAGGVATLDLKINNNVFDFPIGAPGTAAEIVDVAQTIDARYNQWGTLTNAADVQVAISFPGAPGTVLVDPITLP